MYINNKLIFVCTIFLSLITFYIYRKIPTYIIKYKKFKQLSSANVKDQKINIENVQFIKIIDNKVVTEQRNLERVNMQEHRRNLSLFCELPIYSNMLKPCEGSFKWEDRIQNKILRTSGERCHVELYLRPIGYFSVLRIITRDSSGRIKKRGGDYWRVVINNLDFSGNIMMKDLMDGTYEGIFFPIGHGKFTISCVLEYSLCDATRDPPSDWFKKGSFQGKFQPAGTIGKFHDFINIEFLTKTFTIFYRENNNTINNGIKYRYQKNHCVYWYKNQLKEYPLNFFPQKSTGDINKYTLNDRPIKLDTLMIYGDSIGVRFYKSILNHPLCKNIFKVCTYVYNWIYHKNRYRPAQDDIDFYDESDFNNTLFLNDIKEAINEKVMTNNLTSVVVMNFGLHFVMTLSMQRLEMLFQLFLLLIESLSKELGDKMAKVIWKTTTYPALENSPNFYNVTHTRFLTKQRVDLWNAYTIPKILTANISLLHVHSMAASYYKGTVDHVHYKDEVFAAAIEELTYHVKNL